jgi:dipeptidyl aminopeptidase/acylaminoacyl peptidase
MSPRYRIALVLLTLVPCFLGCEDEEIAWLPDSSGLIFRNEAKGWTLYDLKKQAGEQVLKPTEPAAQGIAISPKGDQFALGTVTGKNGEARLQITIYSLAGEVVHQSSQYIIGKYEEDAVPDGVWLEWSTSGRIAAFTDLAAIGLYHPESAQLRILKGYTGYLEARYLGSNLIPDGSGLLAVKIDENEPAFSPENKPAALPNVEVVDWQGRVRSIRLPNTPAALQKEIWDADKRTITADYATWSNQTLRLQMGDFRLDIDPRESKAVWYSNPLKLEAAIPNRDPQQSYLLVPIGTTGVYALSRSDQMTEQLGILDTKTKKVRDIASKVQSEGALRSPDGNKIAITYLAPIAGMEKSKRITLIVDHTGQTIAQIERGVVARTLP